MDFVLENKIYQSVPDTENNCTGCCFNKVDLTECELANDKLECMRNSIKWIEKEQVLKQEGGNHYTKAAIQPVDYIHANKLNFFEGNVVKYVTRHKNKNKAEDIRKAIHYLEMILKFEYSQDSNQESK